MLVTLFYVESSHESLLNFDEEDSSHESPSILVQVRCLFYVKCESGMCESEVCE